MGIWQFGTVELDGRRRELRVAGSLRTIEGKPFTLLLKLLCRAGEVVTKTELLAAVWPGVTVVDGSLSTAINKIRHALGPHNRTAIEVVPRIGYRIAVPTQLRASPRVQLALRFTSEIPCRAVRNGVC